jgi:hypothetical protein
VVDAVRAPFSVYAVNVLCPVGNVHHLGHRGR